MPIGGKKNNAITAQNNELASELLLFLASIKIQTLIVPKVIKIDIFIIVAISVKILLILSLPYLRLYVHFGNNGSICSICFNSIEMKILH